MTNPFTLTCRGKGSPHRVRWRRFGSLVVSVIAVTLLYLPVFSAEQFSYALSSQASFNQPKYYPLEQTIDPTLYRPTGEWLGRLILPSVDQLQEARPFSQSSAQADWTWIELYHTPVAAENLTGQVPVVSTLLRRFTDAVFMPLTWLDRLIVLGILLSYGAIALTLGWRSNFLIWRPGRSNTKQVLFSLVKLFWMPALVEELVFRAALLPHPLEGATLISWVVWGIVSLILFVLYHPFSARTYYPAGNPTFFKPIFLAAIWVAGPCLHPDLRSNRIPMGSGGSTLARRSGLAVGIGGAGNNIIESYRIGY